MIMPDETVALIDAAAQRHGVAIALARAVAWVESRGHQKNANGETLKSPAGALGVFQLMPDTAKGLGVDPHDAAQNIDGGVRFLRHLFDQWGEVNGLAAYNWGAGAQSSTHRARFLAGQWPDETRKYVSAVLERAGMEAPILKEPVTRPFARAGQAPPGSQSQPLQPPPLAASHGADGMDAETAHCHFMADRFVSQIQVSEPARVALRYELTQLLLHERADARKAGVS